MVLWGKVFSKNDLIGAHIFPIIILTQRQGLSRGKSKKRNLKGKGILRYDDKVVLPA
jgi:hypothetical protein